MNAPISLQRHIEMCTHFTARKQTTVAERPSIEKLRAILVMMDRVASCTADISLSPCTFCNAVNSVMELQERERERETERERERETERQRDRET